jgi:acetylornithine deacetylase/succinyl-diaminopimelate desuccinylase-like protein
MISLQPVAFRRAPATAGAPVRALGGCLPPAVIRTVRARALSSGILPLLLLLAWALPGAVAAQQGTPDEVRQLAREILEQLVGIDTSLPGGDPGAANRAMAERLRQAGMPATDVEVIDIGDDPRLGSLVARLRGTDPQLEPVLIMAHIDVVPALIDDWGTDPFRMVERDGFFIGRGTADNKAGAAVAMTSFIRFLREGYRPQRDLIIVFSSDEETGMTSIRHLVGEHPLVSRATLALNTDAGGGEIRNDRNVIFGVQASEKVYQTYQLEVRNPGGHSSVPVDDNAINRLAAGLTRLAEHRFPVQLNEITRTYFLRTAELGGEHAVDMRLVAGDVPDPAAAERLSGSPQYNAQLRTTCVATMLQAGHAENALPQSARATVNCRVLPGEPVDEVDATLRRVLADPAIRLSRVQEPTLSPPSPLTPELLGTIERLAALHFPGTVVIPHMSTGATDGLHTRNAGIPTYGISAMFSVPGETRAHGLNEQVRARSFYDALDFWYDLLRAVGGGR